MSKVSSLSLSDRDKTPAPSGYGYHFHHTNPQRRVPCVLGDMLAPLSADDIPSITPEAMTAVQTAIELLANLVGDRDLGRFLGDGDAKLDENRVKARIILGVGKSLAGILRVTATPSTINAPMSVATSTDVTIADATTRMSLGPNGIDALRKAYEYVRLTMAQAYSWETRDTVLDALSKVIGMMSPQDASLNTKEIDALYLAHEHVRVSMAHSHTWEIRDAAMEALGEVITSARAALQR